jgi:amino acid adenylation domain-containing protein
MQRSSALIVALLAIVKTGAAYLPLDPELPPERVALILDDSEAQLLLTQEALAERLPEGRCPRVCIDREWDQIAAQRADDPPTTGSPQQLAYLMYTSGSTGTPKGVAIRQQSVIRLVARPNYVDIASDDTIAQVSNVAFDAATFEIWGALLHGARLAILPREIILSPPQFVAALKKHQVTCMFLTTALFNRVSMELPDAFRSLRHVLFGGESCEPNRVKAVMKAGPPAKLVHVYGPTETTTFATFHVVRENEEHTTIPIGRPISETQIFVLDRHGQLVPPGVVGEIYIGGLGVAAGYVNRALETQARFVRHPLEPANASLLYRTGDLARWNSDDSLEFLGRNDDQVKIRGFRIEPSEIAAVLATHERVRACHVVAHRRSTGDVGLAAYVVVEAGAGEPATHAALRRFLSARLPGYMVPNSLIAMDALPLTINGKVDVRALPDPDEASALGRAEYVEPRDEIERTMCQVWAETLRVERVGLDDNFFEIGGHSLLAARLFARLDEELGRSPTLAILFVAPTVRQLAHHYRAEAPPDQPARALVPLRSEGTRPPLYFLPGVFGNVVGYADLVNALGPDQPFYGLQSIGLDGLAQPLDSIEAIAQRGREEIGAHQPHGPYAIIGVCFGATVAYELARQLMEAGEVVAFLGLIAPTSREGEKGSEALLRAPRAVKHAVAFARLVRERLGIYLQEMRALALAERPGYLLRKIRSLADTAFKPRAFRGALRELSQLEVYHANLSALDTFQRRPLLGTLLAFEIFETTEEMQRKGGSSIDWQAYWQGPLEWHFLRGKDSGDMLAGSNAAAVAMLLTERLRAAFERSTTAQRRTEDVR